MVGSKDMGKKIGSELSIIGFDDLQMSVAMDPPLTSIRIPASRMGKMAATILIETIEGVVELTTIFTFDDLIVTFDSSKNSKRCFLKSILLDSLQN